MADNNRCHGRCHVSENRELPEMCKFNSSIIIILEKKRIKG